jgi:hypothetical protein
MNIDEAEVARLREMDRWLKLQTRAGELVLGGQREVRPLLDFFQTFVYGTDLGPRLWLETYKALGLESEYQQAVAKLVFPDSQNLWYVPMVPGVTSNKIVAGHRRFGVKFWLFDEDLDSVVLAHDRDANRDGPYIVGFRRNVEADEEFANKSADVLAKVNHRGICLPERLMLGAGYYVATGGQHLDQEVITLCTGSRGRHDSVPHVNWGPDYRKVYVNYGSPDIAYGNLRSRSVVFCSILPA